MSKLIISESERNHINSLYGFILKEQEEKIYTDHDRTWDYKVVNGLWFTRRKANAPDGPWLDISSDAKYKSSIDKLNTKYPTAIADEAKSKVNVQSIPEVTASTQTKTGSTIDNVKGKEEGGEIEGENVMKDKRGEIDTNPKGCMDKKALNYDETAVEDDGSCEYKDKDKKLSKRQVRKIGKGRQRDFIDIELEKLGDGKFSIKKFQNDYKRQEDDIQVVFDIIEELLKTHAIVAKVRTVAEMGKYNRQRFDELIAAANFIQIARKLRDNIKEIIKIDKMSNNVVKRKNIRTLKKLNRHLNRLVELVNELNRYGNLQPFNNFDHALKSADEVDDFYNKIYNY